MGRPRSRLRLAFRQAVGSSGSITTALGAGGGEFGGPLESRETGERGWLQQRASAPFVSAANGPQSDAPGDVHADAPRGGTARDHGTQHRVHLPGSRLQHVVRFFQRLHQVDRLAALGISQEEEGQRGEASHRPPTGAIYGTRDYRPPSIQELVFIVFRRIGGNNSGAVPEMFKPL